MLRAPVRAVARRAAAACRLTPLIADYAADYCFRYHTLPMIFIYFCLCHRRHYCLRHGCHIAITFFAAFITLFDIAKDYY
jgi:hypothetical protein